MKKIKLKDICEVFADGDWIEKKDQSFEGIRLLQTGNIKLGYYSDRKDKARFISEQTFKRLNCTEVLNGDILISRLPDPIGRACIIPNSDFKAITAVDCTIIRTKKDLVSSDFLNYYFQSSQYFFNVKKKVTGSTRRRISRKNLGEIEILLPSLENQKRIVEKLNKAFEEIDKAIKLLEIKEDEVKKLKNSLLREVLSDDLVVYKKVKLGDAIKIARGGSPRPIKDFITTEDNGVNWIKIGDTDQDGKYIYSTKEKIKPEGVARSRYVKENDFILSNSMSFGRPYILKISGCIHDGWLVLSEYQELFTSDYLYYLLTSTLVKNQFERLARGSTVRNLNIELVSQVTVSIPSIEQQQQIVAKLDEAFSEAEKVNEAMRKSMANCLALKSSFLRQELQQENVA